MGGAIRFGLTRYSDEGTELQKETTAFAAGPDVAFAVVDGPRPGSVALIGQAYNGSDLDFGLAVYDSRRDKLSPWTTP